jgi:HSP90 family molecular chaperone
VENSYEVLVLTDAIDEYTIQTLDKFKDMSLVNIGKSGFQIPKNEEDTKIQKKLERYYQPLINWLKGILSSEVEEVIVKYHSQETPMVVLGSKSGYSAQMEKIIKSQATITKDDRFNMFDTQKRNLEINPYHPFIRELLDRVKSGVDSDLEESAKLLFEISLIQAGFELKEPTKFTNKFYKVMSDSLGISRDLEKVEIDFGEIEDEVEQKIEKNENEVQPDVVNVDLNNENINIEDFENPDLDHNMEGELNVEDEL